MINLPVKKSSEIKQIIYGFVNIHSNNASRLVDDELSQTIDLVIGKITSCFYDLNIIVNHIDPKKITEPEFVSKILLWQGLNTLISSLQLIRQGFFTEPVILNRHAVENLALAISVTSNPADFKKFEEGKLSGEKCITAAKKIIPELGEIYGILSKFSHPGNENLGNYYLEDENNKTYAIGGGLTKKYIYRTKFNLAPLGIIAQVFLAGTEFIFWKYFTELSLWKKESIYLKWSPNEDESKYSKELQCMLLEGLAEMEKNNR